MNDRGRMYFGGVPVGPDVKLLMDHFAELTPGREIEHAEVEAVLGLRHTDGRYRTVTMCWRDKLWDELNVRVKGVRGGFEVLTPERRLDESEHQRVKGVRRIAQAVKEAITTPEKDLAPEQRRRLEHLMRTNALAYQAVKNIQRDYGLALKEPHEQAPRPKLPKGSG